MKKIISYILIFVLLFSIFPAEIIQVNAESEDSYRNYNFSDFSIKKPLAQFRLTSSMGSEESELNNANGADDIKDPVVIDAVKGEKLKIEDLSRGINDNVVQYDWQIYADTPGGRVTKHNKLISSLPDEILLDAEGRWDFYLCVRGDTPPSQMAGWQNWSDNGTHRSWGRSSTGKEMWWYFAHIRVNVIDDIKGDITVYYRDVTTDEDLYEPTIMSDLALGSYNINAKPAPEEYKLISKTPVQVKLTATNPSERVYFFYQKQSGAGTAGTIIAYYRDKVTNSDIMPATVYSGLEYGVHQIDAAAAPEKYTLETPSPQMVELSAAQPYKEVVFIYKGDPSMYNRPPVAIIDAPEWVYAGEDFSVSGKRSYDSDGRIVEYQWKYDNEYTGCTLSDQKEGRIWFDYENNGRIDLMVKDNQGATDSARHYVEIIPPIPTAKITPTGILKENRKVNISAGSSWSPRHYPIDHSRNEWSFSIPDIKYKGIFEGRDKDVIFKQAGKKELNLKVWNTYSDPTVPNGFSGELTDDFIIQPDLEPIADFSVPAVTLRDPKDENKATIVLTNTSRSTDGDSIGKTVMFYAYDSNNDNNFDNETWYYSLDGTAWQLVGLSYNQIKTGFDIYDRGTSNPAKFELKVNRNSIGKYKFEAMTIEDIPEDETIKEFLAPEDYKRSDTFSSKPNAEKICDVRNVAPTIDFEVKKIIPMDLVVVTDYAQTDYDNLQAAIDVMKAQVLPLDVEPKVHIVNERKSNAGTREVQKYPWSRYIPIRITGPAFNWNSNFTFDKTVTIGLESLEFFEGEENFPNRSKYSYTIDSWWIGDYENSSGSMLYYYINVDYSVYYNGQLERRNNKEITFAHGQYFNGLGTFFEDTSLLKITFDTTSYSRKFTKADEPSGSEKRPFGTINVDKIKELNIDGDSNKYILFAVENFYNIAEIDSSLRDYLHLNNYGIYIVSNNKTREKSVLMGPWQDVYYYGSEKSYLTANKLYRYDGNELKELPYQERGKPTPVNSVALKLHEYYIRWGWSKRNEEWKLTVYTDERRTETIALTDGRVTVNGTTLNDVKNMYAHDNFYFLELENGDVYYFTRDLRYGGSDAGRVQSYSLEIGDIRKLEGAKGIKSIKSIGYQEICEYYYSDNSPFFKTAKKVFMLDNNNQLFEGKSCNIGSQTSVTDLNYYYEEPGAMTGLSKIESNVWDFQPYTNTLSGWYQDPWINRITYTYKGDVRNRIISKSELSKKIKSDLDVDMYADRDYISLAKMVSGSLKGNTYGAYEYQEALDDIIADISGIRGSSSSYVLLNEKLKYKVEYSDYETDPENQRLWKYIHNPDYFENSMGLDPKSGKDISEPITSFDKVGKFDASLKTQDKPKDNTLFQNYWMWSADKKATIYVHRKPIALIKLNVTPNGGLFKIEAVDGGSYDLDHESRADKGIIAWEWKWKELYDDTWRNERLNKSDCSGTKVYQVALRVKDLEGVWSDWAIQSIDDKQPPIAQFTLDKTPITTDELPRIKDTSYAVMSSLTDWHWIVKRINDNDTIGATLQDAKFPNSNAGTGGYDTNVNLTKANPGVGKYRIYLRVKADNGLWSDGGTDAAPNINKMFYRDLTVNQALKIDDVAVQGRWNHFRGWTDKFGVWKDVMKDITYTDEDGIKRYPYRFLSYEKIDIRIKLEGYADKVIIDFPDGLDRMNYRDKLGYDYSYKEDVGYTVNFPLEVPVNPTLKDPVITWEYILPLVDSTATWENVRAKQPYTINIRAIKGSYEVAQTKKIDITGNVDDLIFIQPVER